MSTSEKQYGPLTLHQTKKTPSIFKNYDPQECQCIQCEEKFILPSCEQQLLAHLFTEHRLVIADVNQIADLSHDLPIFCMTMLLDSKPDGTSSKNEKYYLLSDVLPEDKELRVKLQQDKLTELLERHEFEREDKNFIKECLFCRHVSNGTRNEYLNHLSKTHNFHVAKPDNLIFVDDLINTLASKLEKLQCIYCEGQFSDRNVLKEHMRKKGHKRINPDNKEYDKFFLVNYLGEKRSYKPRNTVFKQSKNHNKQQTSRNFDDSAEDSDPDWSEWTEKNGPLIMCLFCPHTEMEYENILEHMKEQHDFSFLELTEKLSFYEKVKVVNFIRCQVLLKQCLSCDTKFNDSKNLVKHIKERKHWKLIKERWDQPEYYFPTYEDDLFLCFIADDDESWWSGSEQENVENVNNSADNISKEIANAVLSE